LRRKDKQIEDSNELETIIKEATVCRIAYISDGVPYIVPLNYGYQNNCLYFHSASEGHKIDSLKSNNLVCFEMETGVEFIEAASPCKCSTKYRSVIGHGKAVFVEERDAKEKALDIITEHYTTLQQSYPAANIDRITVIRIEIEKISGKKSGY